MTDDLDFQTSAESLPAADIKASNAQTQGSVFATRAFPIRVPNEEREDFIIEIRASQLNKSRARLKKMSKSQFPWYELLLGVSTTLLGAMLGGWAGNMVLTDNKGVTFLVAFPIIGVGTLVAYFFLRKNGVIIFSDLAQEI